MTTELQMFQEHDRNIAERAEMKGALIGVGMVFLLLVISLL